MKTLIALIIATLVSGCTTLYPEDSPEREREHEFQEMHIKHLRK